MYTAESQHQQTECESFSFESRPLVLWLRRIWPRSTRTVEFKLFLLNRAESQGRPRNSSALVLIVPEIR